MAEPGAAAGVGLGASGAASSALRSKPYGKPGTPPPAQSSAPLAGATLQARAGAALQGCAGGSAAASHALACAGGGLRARSGTAGRPPSAPGALPRVVRHGGPKSTEPWPGLPRAAAMAGQPCAAAASSHCSDGRGPGPRRPPAAGQSCSGGSSAGATQDAAELMPPREARLRAPLSRPGTSMPHDMDQSHGSATAALDAAAPLPACRARPDAPPEWPDGVPAQGGAPQRPCRPASTSPLSASRQLASARAIAQLPALPRLCCRLAAGGRVDCAGSCARRARLQHRRCCPACSVCVISHVSWLQAVPRGHRQVGRVTVPAGTTAPDSDCVRARCGCRDHSHAECLACLAAGQASSLSLSTCASRLSVLFQRFFTALSVLRTRPGSGCGRASAQGGRGASDSGRQRTCRAGAWQSRPTGCHTRDGPAARGHTLGECVHHEKSSRVTASKRPRLTP